VPIPRIPHGRPPWVSTDGQSIDAQVRQLRAAGARQVFREVASGAKTDRAQLRRVLAQLDAGDVLMVTRLDRLARSTRFRCATPRSENKISCQSHPHPQLRIETL
jgi:Resolvase, N terminal domain